MIRSARAALLAAVLAGCAGAKNPPLTVQDLEGTWVRQAYIQGIEKTRTPYFAGGLEFFEFRPRVAGGPEVFWANGHEGYSLPIKKIEATREAGLYRVVTTERQFLVNAQRDEDGEITTLLFKANGMSAYPNERFVRLPDGIQAFVAERLVVGNYVDERGRMFSFDPDGTARWPDRLFHYEVSIDPSETDCPYLSHDDKNEPGQKKRYGFNWDGDTLELFNISYDRGTPISCDDTPFARLRRSTATVSGLKRVEFLDGHGLYVLINAFRTDEPDEDARQMNVNFAGGPVAVAIPLGALGTVEKVRLPGIGTEGTYEVLAQFVTTYVLSDEERRLDLPKWKHGESAWVAAARDGEIFSVPATRVAAPTFTQRELKHALFVAAKEEPEWLGRPGQFSLSQIRLKIRQKDADGWKNLLEAQLNFPLAAE